MGGGPVEAHGHAAGHARVFVAVLPTSMSMGKSYCAGFCYAEITSALSKRPCRTTAQPARSCGPTWGCRHLTARALSCFALQRTTRTSPEARSGQERWVGLWGVARLGRRLASGSRDPACEGRMALVFQSSPAQQHTAASLVSGSADIYRRLGHATCLYLSTGTSFTRAHNPASPAPTTLFLPNPGWHLPGHVHPGQRPAVLRVAHANRHWGLQLVLNVACRVGRG